MLTADDNLLMICSPYQLLVIDIELRKIFRMRDSFVSMKTRKFQKFCDSNTIIPSS